MIDPVPGIDQVIVELIFSLFGYKTLARKLVGQGSLSCAMLVAEKY